MDEIQQKIGKHWDEMSKKKAMTDGDGGNHQLLSDILIIEYVASI